MTIQIWPTDFDKREHITKAEREILRFAATHFSDGHIATGINPCGLSMDIAKLGLLISPTKGLITFSLYTKPFSIKDTNTYLQYVKIVESKIHDRLLNSKLLIVGKGQNKSIKFPYKHILIFVNDESITLPANGTQNIGEYISAALFKPVNGNDFSYDALFSNFRQNYDPDFRELTEQEILAIFERIAPEYTIVLHEKNSMTIRIWPTDFDKREHITKAEREILRFAATHFSDGHIATGINPCGLSTDIAKIGLLISPTKGLITFSLYTKPFSINDTNTYLQYVKMVESKIHDRLLNSKLLIVRKGQNKSIKFPYKHILIFANDKSITLPVNGTQNIGEYISAALFKPVNGNDFSYDTLFSNFRQNYDPDFKELTEQEILAIFERIAPEYTIVLHEKNSIQIPEKESVIPAMDMTITGDEVEYKTFLLDDYQVSLVNEMGTGHRVILANPGAGKSVLLLSKAFKYASLYKKSKVLLTSYNNNLADLYNFKRAQADFGDSNNLYIFTFHKLVKKIYEEVWHQRLNQSIPSDEDIKNCISYIKNERRRVPFTFDAIFIDEVQIFDPLYLELCYLLLNKDNKNNIFLMAGDLNQTVRSQSRRGDAPWKKIKDVNLDFSGRVRYIKRNYRNSKLIGEYLNHMLGYMNRKMDELNMINIKEYAYNTFETGDTQSIALKVKTGLNRMSIQAELLNSIKEITTKYNISYSDIAILFPYRQYRSLNYFIEKWIIQALDDEGIPYSVIFSDGKNTKTRYSETNGVVLSTIDSSLGLDFKAVILTGLFPYNYVQVDYKRTQIKSWSSIKDMDDDEKERLQIQMRKIYTAASRARDILYILSDINQGTPMEDILLEGERR